jgi:malate dehydrogenase (oxaloacetate-decarboxylating)
MVADGASRAYADAQVWLIDRQGLLTDEMPELRDYQKPYARPAAELKGWVDGGPIDLLTTVRHVKPTILLGTSTVPGAFTEEVIRSMAEGVERPIVFPLSNPTERIEAMPADVLAWTSGKALCAVGIRVSPVRLDGTTYTIGQANNALLYPGLGLGTIVAGGGTRD